MYQCYYCSYDNHHLPTVLLNIITIALIYEHSILFLPLSSSPRSTIINNKELTYRVACGKKIRRHFSRYLGLLKCSRYLTTSCAQHSVKRVQVPAMYQWLITCQDIWNNFRHPFSLGNIKGSDVMATTATVRAVWLFYGQLGARVRGNLSGNDTLWSRLSRKENENEALYPHFFSIVFHQL